MRRGTRGRGYGGGNWPSAPNRPHNNIPKLLQPAQNVIQPLSAPLMTDHLLGLKDIDTELQLLKRKRQIIEHQQQILTNSYRERNDYEQPMFSQTRESRYDVFASLYDNPRGTEPYGDGGSHSGRDEGSRKRTHFPVWDHDVPAKRFSTPSRGVKKTFGSRLGPVPNQSHVHRAPEPRFTAPKPPKRPPQPPPQKKKEFNPTKVSKPPTVPPLKLASYQPAERKRLVTEALGSGTTQLAVDASIILRADRDPSHYIIGRLELALGAIIKDVKNANPQHERVFKQPQVLRVMKQYIRDRIHTAMVGKPVTNAEEIKHAYYDMFPTADDDVARKGLMVIEKNQFKAENADCPEVYFKKNIRNLMILKMEEMTGKLQEIYCGGKQLTNKSGWYKKHSAIPNKQEEPTKDQSSKDKADDNTKLKAAETQNEDCIKPKIQSETAVNLPKQDETKTVVEATANERNTNKTTMNYTPNASKIVIPNDLVNNQQYLALDKLLTFKILHLIKRFTPEFVKCMDSDAMYRKAKAAIIAETARKLARNENKPDAMEEGLSSEVAINTPSKQIPEKRMSNLHYVKILGKPSLPKRKAMDSFFNQYKPMSVKKHKAIHNLLFAGFLDKESFDRILAADGISIGRFTLDIKVSERNDNKIQSKSDQAPIHLEEDKFNDSSDIIGSELDMQITDLLTSIKKSQEFENLHEDVVMTELPPNNENVKKDNVEQNANNVKSKGNIESNKVTQIDDDVVEIKDVSQNDEHDVVEVKDVPQDDDNEVIHVPQDNANEVIHVVQDDEDEVVHVPQEDTNEVEHVPQDGNNKIEHAPQDNKIEVAHVPRDDNKEIENVPQDDDNRDKHEPQDGNNKIEHVPQDNKIEVAHVPQGDKNEVENVPQDDNKEIENVPQDDDNGDKHVPQDGNNKIEHVPQDNQIEVAHVLQGDKNEVENVPQDDNKEIENVPQDDDNGDKHVPQDNVCEGTDKAQNDGAIKNQPKPDNEVKTPTKEDSEKADTLGPLKTEKSVKSTPTRASARLATPSSIKTRRMSKLE